MPSAMTCLVRLFCLCLILLQLGCGKDEAPDSRMKNLTQVSNIQYYSDSEIQQIAAQVSAELGITVTVSNSKDFVNEYKYRRVLNWMSKHKDEISLGLEGVEKILITTDFGIRESGGRYSVSVNMNTDEHSLVEFFQKDYKVYRDLDIVQKQLSSKIGVRVQDAIGLNTQTAATASNILLDLSKDVNFSDDASFKTLTLSDNFSLTEDGMTININAPYTAIATELKLAIDARITWKYQIAPLLQNLGLSLTYQPGVFTGAELKNVIINLKKDLITIKSLSYKFSKFYIGKRWAYDFNNATLLIDSKSNSEDLKNQLLSLNPPPSEIDLTDVKVNVKKILSDRGFTIEEVLIDLPLSNENLNLIRTFTSDIASRIELSHLKNLQVKVLHLNLNETRFVSGTGVLLVKLPANLSEIESKLKNEYLNVQFLKAQTAIDNHAISIELDRQYRIVFTASLGTIEDLKGFNIWFLTLTKETKVRLGIKQLIITLDTTGNMTSFNRGILTINFYDFRPEKMSSILEPTAPTPAPTPRP
jgi:hypothetical protein